MATQERRERGTRRAACRARNRRWRRIRYRPSISWNGVWPPHQGVRPHRVASARRLGPAGSSIVTVHTQEVRIPHRQGPPRHACCEHRRGKARAASSFLSLTLAHAGAIGTRPLARLSPLPAPSLSAVAQASSCHRTAPSQAAKQEKKWEISSSSRVSLESIRRCICTRVHHMIKGYQAASGGRQRTMRFLQRRLQQLNSAVCVDERLQARRDISRSIPSRPCTRRATASAGQSGPQTTPNRRDLPTLLDVCTRSAHRGHASQAPLP